MIPLSAAIRHGVALDPLEAALSTIRTGPLSPEQALRALHQVWPHIGASVRLWPALAEELERRGMIPLIRPFQLKYRPEVHVSLWKVITGSHDRWNLTNEEIASLLESARL